MDLFEKYYDDNNLEEKSQYSQFNRKQLVIEADYMHNVLTNVLSYLEEDGSDLNVIRSMVMDGFVRELYLISRTIAKPSDCHFEKMTLGDLSKSPNFSKNALAIRGLFCSSPWHKVGGLALCKSLRRTHFTK